MAKRKTFYTLVLVLLAAVIGFSFYDASRPNAATPVPAPEPVPVPVSVQLGAESNVIQPFVKGSLASIVEARSGRPFLVVFWSAYCVSCLAEMPMWRELLDERSDFELVMVSTDKIDLADKLDGILFEYGLDELEAWAFADPIPARVRADVNKVWRGTLPYIHLYGRDGSVKPVTGRIHKDEVESWLDAQAM